MNIPAHIPPAEHALAAAIRREAALTDAAIKRQTELTDAAIRRALEQERGE